MADNREIFRSLKDSNNDGEAPDLVREGDTGASTKDSQLVLPAKNSADDADYLEMRQEGDSVTGINGQIILPVHDDSDTARMIKTRPEDTNFPPEEGIPVLAFKKSSNGGAIYPTTDDAGAINVNIGGGGVRLSASATVAATKGSDIDVAVIGGGVISPTDKISELEFSGSSLKPVLWKVVSVDDALGTPVETVLFSFLTGSGQFTLNFKPSHLDYTAGATGEQRLKLTGNQISGSGSDSDLHGYIGAKAS
jgi:hypothetical protein